MVIRGVICPFLILRFARTSTYHHAHTIDTVVICVMDILAVNAALLKKRHGKGRKWLVTHKIYINNNKTYSYKAGLISPPRLQEQTKLVLWNHFSQPDKQCTVDSEIT